ncbi:unnamed protein product [Spirodela intermedia]|uniref:Uncharacterized protein n=1 Tax=Spirodela intermedia TaxID=51605 RepID=A0A7I8IH28_SPIIN|nr:unnamed protein product [Spirodela intermedia]CAA6656363.1 unnamed protein product [Spirodela intermedia]
MASLPSSLRNRNGFSSMRFLGVLKQQESPTGGQNGGAGLGRHEDGGSGEDRVLELEESDVVWSPACFSDQSESHSPWTLPVPTRRSPRRRRAAPPLPCLHREPGPSAPLPRRPRAPERAPLHAGEVRALGGAGRGAGAACAAAEAVVRPVGVCHHRYGAPHLIVARSHSTTFSVFEGVGRTLKGRDLRRVRNAVFQKTGFLE